MQNKIFLACTFICILFSLQSQVLYQNDQLKLEVEILMENNGFLLSITNKTDSILIINSRKPLYTFLDSTYEIDIQLLDFHSLPTFTEPKEYSITNLKQIFPHVKYDFFIRIDSLNVNFKRVKYWGVELQYITYPINQILNKGYFNFEFRKFLAVNDISLNKLYIKLINYVMCDLPTNLELKNVEYYVVKVQAPITETPHKN